MLAQLMYRLGLCYLNSLREWNHSLYGHTWNCSTHLKLKKCLTYVTLTTFWKLDATCNISPEAAELKTWITLEEMRQMCVCVEQDF